MNQTTSFFDEKHLRYIQRTLRVSRPEVIATIRHSHISAQRIADYIKKQKLSLLHEKNKNTILIAGLSTRTRFSSSPDMPGMLMSESSIKGCSSVVFKYITLLSLHQRILFHWQYRWFLKFQYIS